MLRILFRTSEKYSLHGLKRPFGLTKKKVTEICFKSLIDSARFVGDYKIYVIGDELGEESLSFYKDYEVTMINEKFGNDKSLEKCFQMAKEFPDGDIVYFVEDDYLHLQKALPSAIFFLKYVDGFLHLTDYPNFYEVGHFIQTEILLTPFNHWRRAPSTTFSFMTRAKQIKDNFGLLIKSCENADDTLFSTIFGWDDKTSMATGKRTQSLYSPLPSLATHMHEGTMAPGIDWKKIAELHGGFK